MNFIARYVYTYEDFISITDTTPVQQNKKHR